MGGGGGVVGGGGGDGRGGVLVSRVYSETCNKPAQGTLPPAPPTITNLHFHYVGRGVPAFQGLVASSVRGIFFLLRAQTINGPYRVYLYIGLYICACSSELRSCVKVLGSRP